MPNWLWARTSAVGVFLLVLCSCSERVEVSPAMPPGVVAQIGDRSITSAQWQAALERLGPGATDAQRQQLLDELVRGEVLLAQARNAGYHERPDLRARYEQFVSTTFKEENLQPLLAAAATATDDELAAYYEAHSAQYTTAEAIRLGVIFLKVPAKSAPEQQAQARERAAALLTKAKEADTAGFTRLTQEFSEDQATRYRGGDAGWISTGDGTAGHWPPQVIEAGRALTVPGDWAPAVETDGGLYLVRLAAKRPAARRPLAEVREGIRYLVVREKQQQAERRFYERLSAALPVKLNRPLLDSISISVSNSVPGNSVSPTPPPLPGG